MTTYRAHCQNPKKCRAVTHGHCSKCKPVATRAQTVRRLARKKKTTSG